MKVCFVNLPWEEGKRRGIRAGCRFPNLTSRNTNSYVPFPFLLAYAAAYAERQGARVLCIDGVAERSDVASVCERVGEFRPDLVVAETSTTSLHYDLDALRDERAAHPAARVAVYGSHVHVRPLDALDGSTVDCVIHGEPEVTSVELLRAVATGQGWKGIAGLTYRDAAGRLVTVPARPPIHDLDELPFPMRTGMPMHHYNVPGFPPPVVFMYGSRGCPHKCIFCSVPNHMGRAIRYRSAKLVGDELEYFYKRGVRSFQIGDDNFLAHRPRIRELMKEIESRDLQGAVLRCGQGIRADLINEEVLTAMKRAGFRQLGIGVESGSDRIMQVLCKHLTVAQVDRAVGLACKLGFDVTLLFVYGTPGETLDDVQKSIDLAKEHPVMKAFFFNLVPFPGTALSDWVNEHAALLGPFEHMFNREDEWKLRSQPFFETPEMPVADRVKALDITVRATKEIQVRTLKRKLARFGLLGSLAAELGRFNVLERLFVRNRQFRRILDRVMFGSGS